MKRTKSKGRVARDETSDGFLARNGPLSEAEELALEEIIADQVRELMETRASRRPRWRRR